MDYLIAQSYQILEANHSMSDDEVKSQYRLMVKRYHPDLNKAADAEQKFQTIQNAYELVLLYRSGQYYGQTYTQSDNPSSARPSSYTAAGQTTEYKSQKEEVKDQETYRDEYHRRTYKEPSEFETTGYYIFIFYASLLTLFGIISSIILGNNYYIFFIVLGVLILIFAKLGPISFSFGDMFSYVIHSMQQYTGPHLRMSFFIVLSLFIIVRIGFYTMFPIVYCLLGTLVYPLIYILSPSYFFRVGIKMFIPWFMFLGFLSLNYCFPRNQSMDILAYQPVQKIEFIYKPELYWLRKQHPPFPADDFRKAFMVDLLKPEDEAKLRVNYARGLFGIEIVKDFSYFN